MSRRYREGDLPWNVELPPPEVIALAPTLKPGRMLDLGCGVGRASIYMAQRGWECDGVDFVAWAIELANERARVADVSQQTHFWEGSVGDLDALPLVGPYDFALDVGCLHSQEAQTQEAYARSLARLMRPAGVYLLFGRIKDPSQEGQRWLSEERVLELFGRAFASERVERGTSPFGSPVLQPSAWFWLKKK